MLVHSHKSQTFAARVFNDRSFNVKVIEYTSPEFLQTWIYKNTYVGDSLSIKITINKPSRTVSQNNFYWAYLGHISQETGEEDVERLHELFKGLFLTESIPEVLGHKVRMTKSTTDLSVNEFSEYIQQIEKFTGVVAPPRENFNLAPLKKSIKPEYEEVIT